MPILDIQQRTRELGRIRIGQVVPTSSGKKRPTKLDRFRLTSASRPLLEQVAELYGGEVREWTPQNGGPSAWEVVTDSARLPVYVPPQSVSQWYELWSGGGCQRRCDGQREVLRDIVCPCGPDPEDRECKPTTRLNVVLRDVPGVGVWRLESHGYYAAVELPAVAELLAQTSGYIRAWLALEERTAKREGKTLRWMVPTLEVDITPSALMAGEGGIAPAVASGQAPAPSVAAGDAPAALPAAPSRDWLAEIPTASSLEEMRELYAEAGRSGAPDELARAMRAAMKVRAEELAQESPDGRASRSAPAAPAEPGPDADAAWMACVSAAPNGWSTTDLLDAFSVRHDGLLADDATAAQLTQYAADLRAGLVVKAGQPEKSGTPTLDSLKDRAADQAPEDPSKVPF